MENIEIKKKFSRLKSVSSIDDNYSETATGGVLKNIAFLKIFLMFRGKQLFWGPFLIKLQACKFIENRL